MTDVKPSRRRAPTLVTTFTPPEVRFLTRLCRALLADGECLIAAHTNERDVLQAVAAKFARLHAKMGGAL
jgi:hypothetical protein